MFHDKHEDRARIAHDLKNFLNGEALNEGDALIINKATNNICISHHYYWMQ
jgi:hypothetical protein